MLTHPSYQIGLKPFAIGGTGLWDDLMALSGQEATNKPLSLYQNPSASPVNSHNHFALFKILNSFQHSPGPSTLTHGPQECVCLVSQMCLNLVIPLTVAHLLLCSWGFPRQEYWSGLTCPSPGDLANQGIKPRSPVLQVDSLPSEPPWKPT